MPSTFVSLPKLSPGDKVAILSPCFAAPAVWPHVYELGLERLPSQKINSRLIPDLAPVKYPGIVINPPDVLPGMYDTQ